MRRRVILAEHQNDSMLQSGRYKISIVRLPPAVVPLNMAMAKGHDIAPRYADTEAGARAECNKLVQDGYVVEVTGPNVHPDQADVLRWLSRPQRKAPPERSCS
jgi:hypothetical protein